MPELWPIWQALEEVAWRKEGDRLDRLLGETCERNTQRFSNGGTIERTQPLRDAIEAAENNAMAWRVWDGENE